MNYYEMARTNYFPVKDREAFEEAAQPICGMDWAWVDDLSDDGDHQVALFFEDGVPVEYVDDDGEENGFNIKDFVTAHLREGYVCVLTSIGYEGMRYNGGFAMAFNSSGESVYINTDDIYNKAVEEGLGHITSEATY